MTNNDWLEAGYKIYTTPSDGADDCAQAIRSRK